MNSKSEVNDAEHCMNIVEDIYGIIAQINRYLHMKNTGSVIDIFFYIERSVRAKSLCKQITSVGNSAHYQEELDNIHKTVKSRWQHDFQLIATPNELHQYLKDDGRFSLNQNKIVL